MNTKFTLKNIEFHVEGEVQIHIGELSTEVTDYNLLEGLKVAQAYPAIIKELKDVIIETIYDVKAAMDDGDIDTETSIPFDMEQNVSVDNAIRHLADVMDIDPTQIQIVPAEKVDEEEKEFAFAQQHRNGMFAVEF